MATHYMNASPDYCASPLHLSNMPDLTFGGEYGGSTDSSPSPPMMFSPLNSLEYGLYHQTADNSLYLNQQPITNSIEFMDLTAPQHEDRRRRRSTTAQDKETVSNMRIRRRAQNRASQRAFRERKEKHVQQLEQQLEELESKHQTLAKSYTALDSTHHQLKLEVEQLRGQLASMKSSREGSILSEITTPDMFDQFGADSGLFETTGPEKLY